MKRELTVEEYLKDPCGSSSLPFWKTNEFEVPADVLICRDDEFDEGLTCGCDEPYFKMINRLKNVSHPSLPDEYVLSSADAGEIAVHIRECYGKETVTDDELRAYAQRSVYDQNLWIAVRERETGKIIASGVGEFDGRIGEGVLEWIQVSPDYRHKGFGKIIVCELLERLSTKASFVTVSGRLNSPDDPFSLYEACGFEDPVTWHIIRK